MNLLPREKEAMKKEISVVVLASMLGATATGKIVGLSRQRVHSICKKRGITPLKAKGISGVELIEHKIKYHRWCIRILSQSRQILLGLDNRQEVS